MPRSVMGGEIFTRIDGTLVAGSNEGRDGQLVQSLVDGGLEECRVEVEDRELCGKVESGDNLVVHSAEHLGGITIGSLDRNTYKR